MSRLFFAAAHRAATKIQVGVRKPFFLTPHPACLIQRATLVLNALEGCFAVEILRLRKTILSHSFVLGHSPFTIRRVYSCYLRVNVNFRLTTQNQQ
jgi:hypothetical protein